ncbi:MAG: LruC domain-containing protein [Prevotellaceae bacterium]|nr:LruC domain-containing protein [Prevotellaceae bacterium]
MGKSPYDPSKQKNTVPSADSYFSFDTRTDVQLSVDYATPGGIPLLIEVYRENPVEYDGLIRVFKEGVLPIFSAYTDADGKFEGQMRIPDGLSHVYLHTPTMGLPDCLELEVTENTVSFDHNVHFEAAATQTRAYNFAGSVPYSILPADKLYSLCKWTNHGRLFTSTNMWGRYTYTPINAGYISAKTTVPVWNDSGKTRTTENITALTNRLKQILWGANKEKGTIDNTHLQAQIDQTNFYIAKSTQVHMMLLHQQCLYKNVFGYYYYKGSGEYDASTLKKYIVFPNATIIGSYDYKNEREEILKAGYEVVLKFFGENGDQPASDTFPEGYTIGWFLIPDGLNTKNSQVQNFEEILYSNNTANQHFVSIYDEKYRGVVIGIEDGGDKSYEDMLFCVFTDDMDAIIDPKNPGRPHIKKDEVEITVPDATETIAGTYAFEDIWPSGGDYDMNDVVVEYERAVTFDSKNKVKKIVDTFKPVWDGGQILSAFAYQIDAAQLGTFAELPAGVVEEKLTNSIILYPDHDAALKSRGTYTVTRTFATPFDKAELKEYNPYIIVEYVPEKSNRVEVHLPKHSATSMANASLNYTYDDAYYIKRDGSYPFAIDLPVTGFTIVTERSRIDAQNEYPDFRSWADSNAQTHKLWYLNYQGGK